MADRSRPYTKEEIAEVPERLGLVYLLSLEDLLWVECGKARSSLLALQEPYCDATSFAVHWPEKHGEGEQVAAKLRAAYGLEDRRLTKKLATPAACKTAHREPRSVETAHRPTRRWDRHARSPGT